MKHFLLFLLFSVAYSLAPLKKVDTPVTEHYIVKLKDGISVPSFIKTFEKEIMPIGGGFSILKQYKNVFNGFAARMSQNVLNLLREKEVVDYIEEDALYSVSQTQVAWGLDRIDQLGLPLDNSYNPIGSGLNANVYILDTGINYSHNEFGGRAQNAYDATGGDGVDCDGHGTHCAGIVGGTTYGVAKDVNIFSVRVFGCSGTGYTTDIIEACDWVKVNGVSPGVVSMSFAGGASSSLDAAVSDLVSNGFVVVVAAGNDVSDACAYSPARLSDVITVGATDKADKRTYFSNFGICVDIFAPGVNIESAWIGNTDSVSTLSGTSTSAPHVTGVAAILRSMDDTMTPLEVKNALLNRAIMGAVSDPGDGSPNLLLYVGSGDGPNTPPPEPACSYTITNNGSDVTSPNYPENYDNNLKCDYTIITDDGYYVALIFDDFDLEDHENCAYDVLNIYDDSTSTSSNLIASLCGSNNVGIFRSTRNVMHLTFITDSVTTGRGFSATADFLEIPQIVLPPATGTCSCPDTCDLENNIIWSPNYPEEYGTDEYCSYQFSVPDGYFVNITFLDFNLENSGTCSFDKLSIFDGIDNTTNEIAELCGAILPDPVFTSGSDSFLQFTTDGSVTRTGFQAVITSALTGELQNANKTISPHQGRQLSHRHIAIIFTPMKVRL
ncbi:Proteinase R [Holothuria leucospilota]|uniref:Proteinase R n=1 Tax=Holothuria leucospilota TaxID=206669 RepID=A0A9Q1BBR4_HOLLE|nr:Proteinase R [Holothuria leucospilota]